MAANLPLLPGFIERFIQNWADKRQPEASNQVEVTHRRLYILPTRHGVLFFIVILLILFGAINYENSLGYMLAFLLGSLGMLGMVYTHKNLNHLTLNISRAEPVFAGQQILFPLTISQPEAEIRAALELESSTGQTLSLHLINNTSINCKLPVSTRHRGQVSPGRIKLYTEFPLGLFHAWSWVSLSSHCLVYPAPDPHHYPLQHSEDSARGESVSNKQGADDFAGIRTYQSGDSMNHMAWKAIAKTGELQTKLFSGETADRIIIDWSQLNDTLNTEQRLSILCRMVLDACEKSLIYGLNIPGTSISPDSGLQHKHRCLKALATFGIS